MTIKIAGAYATVSDRVRGMGGTAQDARETLLWFAVRRDDAYEVFALNGQRLVTAVRKSIPSDDFARLFAPDPGLWVADILPVLRELFDHLAAGNGATDMSRLSAAEKGVLLALRTAVAGVEGDRGRVLMDILREAVDHGVDILERQCAESNAMGMRLRKEKDPDGALEHYGRVRAASPADEHLLFNMARAYLEKGEAEMCRALLGKSLALRPDFREARAFLRWLDARAPSPGRT